MLVNGINETLLQKCSVKFFKFMLERNRKPKTKIASFCPFKYN